MSIYMNGHRAHLHQQRLGDVIEHVKKCGAYDFYGMLDLNQADKWIKTIEKAFTML